MPTTVEIDGLDAVLAALRRVDRELPRVLKDVLDEGVERVVVRVRPFLPKVDGDLQQSLRARSTLKEGRVFLGSAKVPYAGWVEFGGTIRQPARTLRRDFVSDGRYFWRRAVDTLPDVRRDIEAGLDLLIDRAGLG